MQNKQVLLSEGIVYLRVDENIKLKTLLPNETSNKYVKWLNDYEVVKYTEQKYETHSFGKVSTFVEKKYVSPDEMLFGIYYLNEHVGNVKLGPINWLHLVAELSFFIGQKKVWGLGIASGAISRAVTYAFETLHLYKVNASYYEANVGSAKTLQKCGFVVEGQRINDLLFEDRRMNKILVSKTNQS